MTPLPVALDVLFRSDTCQIDFDDDMPVAGDLRILFDQHGESPGSGNSRRVISRTAER